MDWYEVTERVHQRTFVLDGCLASLSTEWERELAALWRPEVDVNNGAYLQFLSNWGRESYAYASQALKKTALTGWRMLSMNARHCDEHFDSHDASSEQLRGLMFNVVLSPDGEVLKDCGSLLPEFVINRIYALSDEFMDCSNRISELGLQYYKPFLCQGGSS